MPGILKLFKKKKHDAKEEEVAKANRIFNLNDRQILEVYDIGEFLGKGTFSIVKKGRCKRTGQEVAVKIIDKTSIDVKVESLKTEVQILMNVHHPNIVNLIDVYEDDQRVYLLMDLMTGGELFDRICQDYPNGYSEGEASTLIAKVIAAVEYLHSRGVIHRDLKPENLLFSDRTPAAEIKISDFGLAKIWRGDMLVKTACGSPNYVAPEVLLNDMHGYTFAVDMWSVGVILYVLVCGFCPFYDENTPALFNSITKGKFSYPSPYWDGISEECKDLINHLLVVDPARRFTPQQALQHPWIVRNTHTRLIPNITANMHKFKDARSNCSFRLSEDEKGGER
eukprot:TRINITY_DN504_c0_g3_i1.p1 TRINITY_DN504_c0_g3~~TRINITY_DN504_c0_g3_i1.p1  ORF type:complete len:338 (-),score=97.02 TRINITY_DN504_c0_g3_i1:1087-2100(-)